MNKPTLITIKTVTKFNFNDDNVPIDEDDDTGDNADNDDNLEVSRRKWWSDNDYDNSWNENDP